MRIRKKANMSSESMSRADPRHWVWNACQVNRCRGPIRDIGCETGSGPRYVAGRPATISLAKIDQNRYVADCLASFWQPAKCAASSALFPLRFRNYIKKLRFSFFFFFFFFYVAGQPATFDTIWYDMIRLFLDIFSVAGRPETFKGEKKHTVIKAFFSKNVHVAGRPATKAVFKKCPKNQSRGSPRIVWYAQ
jgi:hypothetical protein